MHEADPVCLFFVVQDDDATDAVRVTVEILSRRVHDDIDTELQWTLQVWRHESVVTNDACSSAMRDLADLLEIRKDHYGISRRLDKYHLCVWFDCRFDVEWIGCVNVIEREVVVREYEIEETRSAAVGIVGHDDVFAAFDESQRGIDRGHAGSERITETSAFECGDISFDCRARRVLRACVLVTFVLPERVLCVS